MYIATNLNDATKVYSKLGFVLLKNFISESFVDLLKSESNQLIDSCVSGTITRRMQINPNYYIGRSPSVWGINDFLCDFPSNLKYRLINDLLSTTVDITSINTLNKLSLNRIHFQRKKFLHKLFWHHDCVEFNKNFVVNLYLENETGFRLTDRLNPVNSRSDNVTGRGGMYLSSRNDYITISCEAGDLLIFDGRLLHQPYNKSSRMHLHFVFQNDIRRLGQKILIEENDCLGRNDAITVPFNNKFFSKSKFVAQYLLDKLF